MPVCPPCQRQKHSACWGCVCQHRPPKDPSAPVEVSTAQPSPHNKEAGSS